MIFLDENVVGGLGDGLPNAAWCSKKNPWNLPNVCDLCFYGKKVSHIICLLSNMYEDICLSVQGRTSKKKKKDSF